MKTPPSTYLSKWHPVSSYSSVVSLVLSLQCPVSRVILLHKNCHLIYANMKRALLKDKNVHVHLYKGLMNGNSLLCEFLTNRSLHNQADREQLPYITAQPCLFTNRVTAMNDSPLKLVLSPSPIAVYGINPWPPLKAP